MKAKLSKKIRAKIDSHPTHSELVAWAKAAEKLEGEIERRLPSGFPCVDDFTEIRCSVKDLVFRKLNPPTALAVSVEARRAEEALFAA